MPPVLVLLWKKKKSLFFSENMKGTSKKPKISSV